MPKNKLQPKFVIATPENTAEITLNDNMSAAKRLSRATPAPTETLLIGDDVRAIAYAVYAYAKRHRISIGDVGYSVKHGGK